MKTKTFLFLLLICILLTITLPTLTKAGAKTGLELWLFTLIPTLFPFLIFTNLLNSIHGNLLISHILKKPVQALFPVSDHAVYAILIGLLCGYPMGAKAVSNLLSENKITNIEAQYLLRFCNYPSPMFVVGYLCPILQCNTYLFIVLTAIYGSAFLCGQIFRPASASPKSHASTYTPLCAFQFSMIDYAIKDTCYCLMLFGGYVILYSIAATYVASIHTPMGLWQILGIGLLEITNGTSMLASFSLPVIYKLPLACFFVTFGGLSTFSQTISILKGHPLSKRHYLYGKLLNGLLSAILCYLLLMIIK